MSIPENIWNKAEQNMARRERLRLIKNGRIRFTSPANVLVKTVVGPSETDVSWRFPSLREE